MRKRLILAGVVAVFAAFAVTPIASAVTTIRNGGSTGLQLLATALAIQYQKDTKSVFKVTVAGGGSGAGITGANTGTFDIGNSSRDKRSSDPAALVFTPISREPFVIIVHKSNPTANLTLDQIKGLLTGAITNWSQVGWEAGGPVKVYGRVSTSGTFASCKLLFTANAEYAANSLALASNALDRTYVQRNKGGIACVTLPYLTTAQGTVKGVSVEGVQPTIQNAASGRYKYINNQYFVTKGDPAGDVAKYVQWALSKKTQCAVVSRYALPVAKC